MIRRNYIALTGPRDNEGRAPFTMFWLDTAGPWRTEASKTDGNPVGYRRAQCFRALPEEYIERGSVLVDTEGEAERLGHRHPDMDKPVRTLRCSCCDGRARGRQWHNRDIGYGMCVDCVDWIRKRHAEDPKRGENEDEIRRLYGVEGVHWNVHDDQQAQ